MFHVDVEQIRDAATDQIPRFRIRLFSSAQNFTNADSETFLTIFKVFQDSSSSDLRTAIFSQLRQRFL